eukprot:Transcript_14471.p5 GENE.Transcript_14471~~Transcript_14471.p5  ORF type:complete len:95 (-),score=5.10 Transcript_14471:378-662(-)
MRSPARSTPAIGHHRSMATAVLLLCCLALHACCFRCRRERRCCFREWRAAKKDSSDAAAEKPEAAPAPARQCSPSRLDETRRRAACLGWASALF